MAASTPVDIAGLRDAIGLVLEARVPEIKRVQRYATTADFNSNMPVAMIDLDADDWPNLDEPWGPLSGTDSTITFLITVVGLLNPTGDNEADLRLSDIITAKLRPAFESYPLLEIGGTALAVNTAMIGVQAGQLTNPGSDPAWILQATLKTLVTS